MPDDNLPDVKTLAVPDNRLYCLFQLYNRQKLMMDDRVNSGIPLRATEYEVNIGFEQLRELLSWAIKGIEPEAVAILAEAAHARQALKETT
jgi:hypothetical protein